jgi:hypothetical protein
MKSIAILLCFILIVIIANAQKGGNQLKIIAESGFPIPGDKPGFGGYLKGLKGIGNAGHVSFTFGVAKFSSTDPDAHSESTYTFIPFLAGYRHNFAHFYIEPQLGLGAFNGKIHFNGDYSRPSNSAFFWAINTGYNYNRIDIGIRFQQALRSSGDIPGIWENKSFGFAAINLAYNLYCSSCRSDR